MTEITLPKGWEFTRASIGEKEYAIITTKTGGKPMIEFIYDLKQTVKALDGRTRMDVEVIKDPKELVAAVTLAQIAIPGAKIYQNLPDLKSNREFIEKNRFKAPVKI